MKLNEIQKEYQLKIKEQLIKNQEHLESLNYEGCKVNFPIDLNELPKSDKNLKIFFFDIDNCLYNKSSKIEEYMLKAIFNFLEIQLGLNKEEAIKLNHDYYTKYGLVIKGLVKFHNVNALDFNRMVDDSLPLQDLIQQDLKLRQSLLKIKQSGKFDKFWLFTNAYKNHAIRCIRILGIADLFDGITYSDYGNCPNGDLICKPDPRAFERAKTQSGLGLWSNSWFADDSIANLKMGLELGMKQVIKVSEDEILYKNKNNNTSTAKLLSNAKNDDTVTDLLSLQQEKLSSGPSSQSLSSATTAVSSTTTLNNYYYEDAHNRNTITVNTLSELSSLLVI